MQSIDSILHTLYQGCSFCRLHQKHGMMWSLTHEILYRRCRVHIEVLPGVCQEIEAVPNLTHAPPLVTLRKGKKTERKRHDNTNSNHHPGPWSRTLRRPYLAGPH